MTVSRHLLPSSVLRRASDLKSRTNLITEDRLSEIFEKPEHNLNVISRQRQLLLVRKRPQLFLDCIELAKGE